MALIDDNKKRLAGASGNQGAASRNNTGLAITPSSNPNTSQVLGMDANQGQRDKYAQPSKDGLLGSALPNVTGNNKNNLTVSQIQGMDDNQGGGYKPPIIGLGSPQMLPGLTAKQAIDLGSKVSNPNTIQKIGQSLNSGYDYVASSGNKLGSEIYDSLNKPQDSPTASSNQPISLSKVSGNTTGTPSTFESQALGNRQPLATSTPNFTNNPATQPSNPTPTQTLLSNTGISTTPLMSPEDKLRQAQSADIVQRLGGGDPSYNALNPNYSSNSIQGNPQFNSGQSNYQAPTMQRSEDSDLTASLMKRLDSSFDKKFHNTEVSNLLAALGHQGDLRQGDYKIASGNTTETNRLNSEGDLGYFKANQDAEGDRLTNQIARETGIRNSAASQAKLGQDASQHEDDVSQLVMKNLLARKDLSPREKFTGAVQDSNGRPIGLDHLKNIFSEDNYDNAMSKSDKGFTDHLIEAGIPHAYIPNLLAERRVQGTKNN
jgi:hypothetical protein